MISYFAGSSESGSMLQCRTIGVLKEPRPAARREYRRKVPGGGSGSAAGEELLSTDHFTVDRTLIEAWASLKALSHGTDRTSRRPVAGAIPKPVHGKKRSNQTHVSTTDPDARLYRKGPGKEAKLCSSAMA